MSAREKAALSAIATNETVTLAAREAYASVMRDSDSRDGYNASGDAIDAAGAAIKAIVGGRTGYFDAETLTWTFDAEVQS